MILYVLVHDTWLDMPTLPLLDRKSPMIAVVVSISYLFFRQMLALIPFKWDVIMCVLVSSGNHLKQAETLVKIKTAKFARVEVYLICY